MLLVVVLISQAFLLMTCRIYTFFLCLTSSPLLLNSLWVMACTSLEVQDVWRVAVRKGRAVRKSLYKLVLPLGELQWQLISSSCKEIQPSKVSSSGCCFHFFLMFSNIWASYTNVTSLSIPLTCYRSFSFFFFLASWGKWILFSSFIFQTAPGVHKRFFRKIKNLISAFQKPDQGIVIPLQYPVEKSSARSTQGTTGVDTCLVFKHLGSLDLGGQPIHDHISSRKIIRKFQQGGSCSQKIRWEVTMQKGSTML